jgi:ELWxxDGT repeat protein
VWAQSPEFSGLLFSAGDGQHGHELWRSDGQADDAELVKDINPGPDHS